MAARQQLEGMRRAFPGDGPRQLIAGPGGQLIVAPDGYQEERGPGTGQYL
jgi:hypothetical protein